MLTSICARLAGALILWAAAISGAAAGPGHDHEDEAHVAAGPASPRVVATSEAFELVGILKDGKLTIYLDRAKDTSPITNATIDLTVGGETKRATPGPDGTYEFKSTVLAKHGDHEVIVSIEHEGQSDLLVGVLKDGHAHGEGHAHDHDHEEPAPKGDGKPQSSLNPYLRGLASPGPVVAILLGGVAGAFVRGRMGVTIAILGLATALGAGTVSAGPGHDHDHGGGKPPARGDAPHRTNDGEIFLPKPTQRLLAIRTRILAPETAKSADQLVGRIIADPNRSGLVQSTIGGRVQAAANGLPTLGQHVKKGDILACIEPSFAPIDASDVRQTAGDLAQRIAVLEARLARQKRLVATGVANPASLEDIAIEREGLEARRRELEKSQREPEALVAPVDGVIADVRVVAGQVVAVADTLFNILDPQSLWVEAISFEPGLSPQNLTAKARTPDSLMLDLAFVGRGRTLQQQASVLQFKVASPADGLSIGSPVKVMIEKGEALTGLVVPREAIAQAPNGQLVAFRRLEPERYLPAAVRIKDLDGERVLVTSGLKEGDQIIIEGAPLVNQIR